jgi:hypothetical protein
MCLRSDTSMICFSIDPHFSTTFDSRECIDSSTIHLPELEY